MWSAVEAEIAAIGILHGVSFAFGFDGDDGVLDIAGEFAVGDGNVGEAEAAECGAFGDNGAELVVGYHYIFGTGSDGGGFQRRWLRLPRNNHFALEFEELGFGGILEGALRAGSIRRNRKRDPDRWNGR